MQFRSCVLQFLLITHAVGLVTKVEENPIRKITGMLQDLKTELEHEAETEAEVFEKAMCICESGSKELSGVIDHSNSEIERLTTKIEKDTAQKAKLDKEVAIGEKDKVDTEQALAEAIAIREKEAAKFAENEKTAMFSIDQLNRAIPMFEKQGAAGLLQTDPRASFTFRKFVLATPYLNSHKRNALLNFLQSGANGKLTPAAQEIIGIMEAMHDEMSQDLADARFTEKEAVATFVAMKEAKEEHLGLLMKQIADKIKRSGSLAVEISNDKDSLEDTNTELSNAQKYLASLNAQCAERRKFRDERAKMRNDEIVAVGEAMKILTEDDALETFKKAVPSSALVQKPRPTYDAAAAALLQKQTQLRNTLKVRKSITASAHAARNPLVPAPANESASAAAKVVHFMVDNMIETLHEDDVSDEHKLAYCQNETEVYEQLRTDKWAFHDQLTKEIEGLNNEIAQLEADIKALLDAINAMDQSIHDATELRKKEHDEYQVSAHSLSTAATLIDKAAKRLAEFYSPSANKAAFLSTSVARPQYTSVVARRLAAGFDDVLIQKHGYTAHHKKSGVDPIVLPDTPTTYEKKESGGVLNLMAKMKSDLLTDLREAEVEENRAGVDYAEIMKESKETRDADVKALHDKKAVLADTEEKLAQAKQQLDLTNEEIHQLELYLHKVHVECDFLMANIEKRHDARVDEEHGLDEAESIVTGADVPSHMNIDKVYEEEHTKPEVDAHFPEEPMPEVR